VKGPRPLTYAERSQIHRFLTGNPLPDRVESKPEPMPPRPWGAVAVLSSLAVIAMALSVALGGWPMAVLIGFMSFAVLGSLVFVIAKDGESGVRL
jgi:hypothetical protein